jgi:hypothetical protein
MGVEYDFSDFQALAADIGTAIPGGKKNFSQALTVTARHVKDDWNDKLYSEGHAKRTGRAITYDVSSFEGFGGSTIEAEIGAVKGSGRQAGVVRLLENGSIHNGAHGYGAAALQANQGDFEHGVQTAIDDAMRAAGL